jgi:hypothetical protein
MTPEDVIAAAAAFANAWLWLRAIGASGGTADDPGLFERPPAPPRVDALVRIQRLVEAEMRGEPAGDRLRAELIAVAAARGLPPHEGESLEALVDRLDRP